MIEISKNTSGKVRDRLYMEDIQVNHMDVAVGFGLVNIEFIGEEAYAWFKEPIRVPSFSKFYSSRIKSVSDPWLLELIRRLLYLNPSPDKLMVKKITEFIILRFSAFTMEESKVKAGEVISTPVLKFETVEPVVQTAVTHWEILDQEYEPDAEVIVLFSKDSKLSKEDKMSISVKHRSELVKQKMESVIHNVAEILIEKKKMLTVNNSRIKNTGLVKTKRGVASLNTIGKYMAARTLRVIEEHNSIAPFKTEKTQELYLKFSKLPEKMPIKWYADALNTSNSTIIEFKKLEEQKSPLVEGD